MTNHFDTVAHEWDKNQIHVKRTEAIAACLLDMIEINNKCKALEFGAGTGLLSFELKDHFSEITVMDSSAGMINIIFEKIKQAGISHIHPIFFDLEKNDYTEKTFDIIFSQMALHHILNIEKIIETFSNLILPGGKIAIADLYKEDGTFHDNDFEGHKGFDPGILSEILTKHNFINVKHKQCFVIEKVIEEGEIKKFPIFLMTAEKQI